MSEIRQELERIWRVLPCRFPGHRAGWYILDWELKSRGGYYLLKHVDAELDYQDARRKSNNPAEGDIGSTVCLRGLTCYNAAVVMRAKQRARLNKSYDLR